MPLDHPYHNLIDGQWMSGVLHVHSDDHPELPTPVGGEVEGAPTKPDILRKYYSIHQHFLMYTQFNHYCSEDDLDTDVIQQVTGDHKSMLLIPGLELHNATGPHFSIGGFDDEAIARRCIEYYVSDHPRKYLRIAELVNANCGLIVSVHPNFDGAPIDQTTLESIVGLTGIEVLTKVSGN